MDEFKMGQRATWAAGDYAALSPYIEDLGDAVVKAAGVSGGMKVLDVACGPGNAAIQAAAAGGEVTGLDLVPDLLSAARRKADAAGVEIEWVEGDAEALPFEAESFDRVVSTVGHMFAPRHDRTAAEMARVCRPGGVIAFAAWTPGGSVGKLFAATAPYAPPPPDYASPPILWGDEEHVRELFGAAASGFEFERRVNHLEWDSIEGFADFFMPRFGPMVMAQQNLGDRFAEMRAKVLEVWDDANEADDGSLRLPQEYLLSIVRI